MFIWFLKWIVSPITAALFGGSATYYVLLTWVHVNEKSIGSRQLDFLEWLLILFVAVLMGAGMVIWSSRPSGTDTKYNNTKS